jgi:hypothetical protein
MANTCRKLLADAIERNCGYSSGYHDRYALSWNVALDSGVPDWDGRFIPEVMERYKENFGGEPVFSPEQLADFESEWDNEGNQNRVWESVRDSMAGGVTDCDTYRTWSPEVERKYSFKSDPLAAKMNPKKTFTGKHYDYFFDVFWEFAGRCGKHLCLTEFEGLSLGLSADDLADAIRNDEGNYPNEWCRKLLAMIEEWDKCFSHEAVRSEFRYQAAQQLNEKHEEYAAACKEEAEARFWAERGVQTVTH